MATKKSTAKTKYVNVDLAKIYESAKGKKAIAVLAWGDPVRVKKTTADAVEVEIDGFVEQKDGSQLPVKKPGFIRPGKFADALVDRRTDVLRVDFVDVQQGDGAVIESPDGKVVLVDGGDNQLFARYLAGRFRGTSEAKPKEIDCIVVTHGDADHFEGLARIHESETHKEKRKRLFIHPGRIYHNGLVKRPSTGKNKKKRRDEDMLGATTKGPDGRLYVTGLEENLFKVPDSELNVKFLAWKRALEAWRKRGGAIKMKRLEIGMHDAFDFLRKEKIEVEVLGPITEKVGNKRGLPFLGNPPKGPRIGHESLSLGEEGFSGKSASHTINGHSVIFRLTYGDFSFLFTGDLNDEAGRILGREHNKGTLNLRAEVFKVPHHGSADFSGAFIQMVSPVVSVVSSGDESARKEYIHPRATIIGALGKYSRVEEPLIFVTELVAFFAMLGYVNPECHQQKDGKWVVKNNEAVVMKKVAPSFFAFQRTAFGIVKIRTDGKRMLVFTNSGQTDLKEAYCYTIDEWGKPQPVMVRQI